MLRDGRQHTNPNISDYSSYSSGNMLPATSGPFLYSQTGHTDLQGPVWDTSVEGPQNFHGDDDFHYTYGHSTPRGQDQAESLEEAAAQWITPEQPSATVAKSMRRVSSHSSSGSRKNRTIKASANKRRPKVLTAPQPSQLPDMDLTGIAQVDAYLLSDSDTHSVSSQLYYQPATMSVGLATDGLPCSPAIPASGMTQQHIDPAQMQLDFDPSLTGNSPTSWSALSPVESRLSSPALPEDASAWSVGMDASPTHTSDSSPVIHGISPRYVSAVSIIVGGVSNVDPNRSLDRQMGLISAEDPTGLILSEDSLTMASNFTRRSSGDGDYNAPDQPLKKKSIPHAHRQLQIPWESQSYITHKPEKHKIKK
jgi:hypothetical protein